MAPKSAKNKVNIESEEQLKANKKVSKAVENLNHESSESEEKEKEKEKE